MTNLLDGGKQATFKRRWVWDAHNEKDGGVLDDRERGDLVKESMAHFMEIHAPHFERNYRPKVPIAIDCPLSLPTATTTDY
jgi:hypothetical protein